MYEIHLSDGREWDGYETYEAAIEVCEEEWPYASIGHSGDLSDGGDRTLVWESALDARDDDGRRAVAEIRRGR